MMSMISSNTLRVSRFSWDIFFELTLYSFSEHETNPTCNCIYNKFELYISWVFNWFCYTWALNILSLSTLQLCNSILILFIVSTSSIVSKWILFLHFLYWYFALWLLLSDCLKFLISIFIVQLCLVGINEM